MRSFFKLLPQHDTLNRLMLMRAVTLIAQSLVLLIAHVSLHISITYTPMLVVMLLMAMFNMGTWYRLQKPQLVGEKGLFLQFLTDILALTVWLYYSGGATNPFVSFYLPLIAVAAAILPGRFAASLAALSLLGYSFLTFSYIPLNIENEDKAIFYHLSGMWLNFAFSAALITWFVVRMSSSLRKRSQELAQAKERYLQSERVVALATQAANAAHEMGTPLSTISVVVSELNEQARNVPELKLYQEDFDLIESQIGLCKRTLQNIVIRAEYLSAEKTPDVVFKDWFNDFLNMWRLRHPAIRVETRSRPSVLQEPIYVSHAQLLSQIFVTVLDNAAQASALSSANLSANSPPTIQVYLEESESLVGYINVRIEDNGEGISKERVRQLGYRPVESTTGGQGIGLLLAFATARQIGVSIVLDSIESVGTTVEVAIPILNNHVDAISL
ncbi:MAG: ATP-binding protein [Pseudomonadota bacterium]